MEEQSATTASNIDIIGVRDRIRGLIYGACCGNSLGGSGVGLNHKDIAARTGISGLTDFSPGLTKSLLPNHEAGDLLADSYMGLALAQSLIDRQGRFDDKSFKSTYAALLENNQFLKVEPGAVCLAGLRKLVDGEAPAKEGLESLHANVAARVFAVGALPGGEKSDQPVDVAVKQSRLSHGDTRAGAAAAVIADSLNYLVCGGKLNSSVEVHEYVAREFAIAQKLDERFAEAWDDVAPDLDYTNPAEELPYSLVNVESNLTELVPTAVGIFLIFRNDPKAAIRAAARSGGDTDTIATIVGALSGALHGFELLPKNWTENIHEKEKLDAVAESLSALWN